MTRTNSGMIQRNNLMSLLDGISEEQAIYVCAPAGYGKTVAIKQWLERSNCNHALLSLDEFDNEPAHFCRRFCDALTDCQPENERLQHVTHNLRFDNAPIEFTIHAITALSKHKHVRLAIDDLHFVKEERTLGLLLSFLKRLPNCFRLALISRNELPLGFSDLWLKGRIVKIDTNDLRFDSNEIAALYKKHGFSITPQKADEIQQYTYGWAIGLGALLLSGGEPDGERLKYLEEYLKTHIWQSWDMRTQEFMLKTSVVSKLTPALCTALTGVADSGVLLDELVQQNVFISRERNGVYKYHQLFHSYLTHLLEERGENISHTLLSKAGDWYLTERDFFNAVECFIKSEDKDGLIRCLDLLFFSGRESFIADRLLPIFDTDIVASLTETYPNICIMLTWAAYNQGRIADFARYADQYYHRAPEAFQSDPMFAYNIVFFWLIDYRITLFELVQSLGKLPLSIQSAQSDKAKASPGTINQNMPLLHRGTRDFSECALKDVESSIALLLSSLGGLFGDEANLLAASLTAGLLFEQGSLEKAYVYALKAYAEIKERFVAETKFCVMSMLVNIHDALGNPKQAETTLNAIDDLIKTNNTYSLNYNFYALKTRHFLSQGDIIAANDWLDKYAPVIHSDLYFYNLYGHITTCRAYITIGDYDSAIILLGKILSLIEAYNRPLDIIEVHILFSIAFWKKKSNFQTEAIRHLEQALSIAHRYGFTQLFINDGAELSGMLLRIKRRAEQNFGKNPLHPGFVKLLYLKVKDLQNVSVTSKQAEQPEHLKFTDKQKNVMKLLGEGKSYREICETLGITRPTLRSHLNVIYNKLGVADGTEAIKKIDAIGVFAEN